MPLNTAETGNRRAADIPESDSLYALHSSQLASLINNLPGLVWVWF